MIRGAQRLGVALLVAGCSTTPTTTTYVVGYQPVARTGGWIAASRVVGITGDATEAAPLTGATFGGILGPLGSLVGAGIGYLVERWMRVDEGIEYLVEMGDGRTVTIVQDREGSEQPLPEGTPVLVETDSLLSSRVVEHPDAARSGAGGAAGWVDPDALPPPGATPPPPPEAIGPLQPRWP